ncbi:hypothetical protein Ciccas_013451 [Cichlidogyrus casuarinus]|uniref:Uncharacterized protein n=1 Tax=Cichlidogyrus casuarinus TaxID=1844966 RepID=A0ABD2PKP2_9PLAT
MRTECRECVERCERYSYEKSLSVTSWKPWKANIHVYSKFLNSFEEGLAKLRQTLEEDNENLREYLKLAENLSSSTEYKDSVRKDLAVDLSHENAYTMISLHRRMSVTHIREERLVIDIFILISRVGGLFSLTIGLSAAFLVEMIELIYLACQSKRTPPAPLAEDGAFITTV